MVAMVSPSVEEVKRTVAAIARGLLLEHTGNKQVMLAVSTLPGNLICSAKHFMYMCL